MRPFLPSFASFLLGLSLIGTANVAQAAICPPLNIQITSQAADGPEGNSGTTLRTWVLTKAGAGATVVPFTLGGLATYTEDYTVSGSGLTVSGGVGTISFNSGTLTRTINVSVKGDTKYEFDDNETIDLNLAAPTNGFSVCGPSTATTTIQLSQDTQPTVKVGWNNVAEGAGTATVTVTLSNKSYQPVGVDATSSDGTAIAPGDYAPVALSNQLYGVSASSNANGLLYMNPSTGAITGGQVISVGTHSISSAQALTIDPTTGKAYAVVTSEVGRLLVTLDLATGTGVEIGALSPSNFVSLASNAAGELFGVTNPGRLYSIDKTTAASTQVASLASVGCCGHAISYRKTDNSFYHWTGDGTITLERVLSAPPYTITPITTVSGSEVFGAGWNPLTDQFLTTHYSNSSVDFWSSAGVVSNPQPALGGRVRGMASNLLVVSPDSLTATFPVSIVQDLVDENNETFTVTLANPVNATLGSPFTQTHSILDDDNPPTVSISPASASVVEGNSGTQLVMFTATLSAVSGKIVAVGTTTTPGTASSPSDYAVLTIPSGVTFNPGETSKTFAASVKGDGVLEPDEAFFVNVVPNGTSSTAGAPTTATLTIQNDDSPALVVNDPIKVEGNSGTSNMMFTVSITSPAPPGGVGFDYITSDGSATAGSDYAFTSGTVLGNSGGILAGNTSTTIAVPINGDTAVETHETLTLTISNPTGTFATILDNQGVGTIQNDDLPPAGSLVISEFRQNGIFFCEGPCTLPVDEFVEIANTTANPITVVSTDLSAGFSVAKATSGGEYVFTIPNGTVIPARGHYLGANTAGYSLNDYGGTNMALPDATWTTDIPDNTGLALFPTSNPLAYGTSTPFDSVGFVGDAYVQGTGLTPLAFPTVFKEGSWVRRHVYGGGSLQNTNDSAADFVLVDPYGSSFGGNTAVLGGPSPENLAAETERTSAELTVSLLDTFNGQYAGDNYQFNPENVGVSPKSIELRRVFTNNTAGGFSALRFKATSLTTLNSNGGGTQADFRPASTVDTVTGSGTAYALTLEQPPFYSTCLSDGCVPSAFFPADVMGGLNSSLRLNQVPLAASGSVAVNFRLIYTLSGAPGFFWVTAEAKP